MNDERPLGWLERHLARTVNGTVQLGGRRWRWLWESREGRTIIARCCGTTALGWTLWRLGGQWPWVYGAAVGLVLAQAYRGADDQLPDADAAEDEPIEDDGEPEMTAAETLQLIIDSVHHLAGGFAGVHLIDLFVHMDGHLWCADLSEFRRWVESYDVPVLDSVKAAGRVRIGIRVADLPQPPASTPPPTPPPADPDDLFQDW